jgi:hypothetical protein
VGAGAAKQPFADLPNMFLRLLSANIRNGGSPTPAVPVTAELSGKPPLIGRPTTTPPGTQLTCISRTTLPLRAVAAGPLFGEPTAPPRIAPARGRPLREAEDAAHNRCADPLLQCVPAFEFDQRFAW